MRILFFDFNIPYLIKDNEFPVGGFTIQLSNWIIGLGERKEDVGVLSWEGANDYAGKPTNFSLVDTYNPKEGIKILKYFYLYIPKLISGARKFKPDVMIQACSGVNTGIIAFVAGRLGVPFVYRVANDMDVDGRCHERLRGYEKHAYYYGLNKAAAILCQNDYQYDCLKKKYPDKALFKIHNPFDIRKVLEERKPRCDRNYVAWLGVFQRQKNMQLLLTVASKLPHIHFKIAGMPGKTLDQDTESAISALKQLPNVSFAGYVKRTEILEFLNNAFCLLSTSHYEGFSNAFLESFAAGTPVICPSRIDPDKLIGTFGLGHTSKSDDELAGLVDKLHEMDATSYEQLSSLCSGFLLDNFSPSVKAEQLVDSLKKVV